MPAHAVPAPDRVAEAPLRRRAASLFYEALLLVAVLWCASLPLALIQAKFGLAPLRLVYQLYLSVAAGVYFVWHWTRTGQTLPMKTWRLRLVSHAGTPVTLGQAVLRYIAALIGVPLFGACFLWAFVDRERRFLHDRLAGTCIVGGAAAPRNAARSAEPTASGAPDTTSSRRPPQKTRR